MKLNNSQMSRVGFDGYKIFITANRKATTRNLLTKSEKITKQKRNNPTNKKIKNWLKNV